MLETVEINPKNPAKHSVIWMHGLGADGHDFEELIPELGLPNELAIRFIFPHANKMPITFAQNAVMRAWFNFHDLSLSGTKKDEKSIYESQRLVDELIDREISRGIDSKNIVLAGFSQGGAMALQCGLRYREKLAGILVLSGFLLLPDRISEEKHSSNNNTPILILHGTEDNVVRLDWAESSYAKLLALNFPVEMKTYHMAHSVSYQEVKDISAWFTRIFG